MPKVAGNAPTKIEQPPTFVDLFAGCGGLSLGLLEAGWTGLFAIERDGYAFSTLQHNLISRESGPRFSWLDWVPQTPLEIGGFIDAHEQRLKNLKGKVTLLAGGPPCQGFSLAGKRNPNDPRNKAFLHFVRAARLLEPQIVLLENVAGIGMKFRSSNSGQGPHSRKPVASQIVAAIQALGYEVFVDVLSAADFGVAQLRHRYFLIGVHRDCLSEFEHGSSTPNPFTLLKRQIPSYLALKSIPPGRSVTAAEAISDLECTGRAMIDCEDTAGFCQIAYEGPVTDYQKTLHGTMDGTSPNSLRLPKHRPEIVQRFSSLIQTCRHGVSLSEAERASHGITKASLTILDSDKPSHTLTTLPDDIVHYLEPRILTVREYARLQSFPDWFAFQGNYTTGGHRRQLECPRYTQVANAVPPLLAEAIGRTMLDIVQRAPRRTNIPTADAIANRSNPNTRNTQRTVAAHLKKMPSGVRIQNFRSRLEEWFQVNKRHFAWRQPSIREYEAVVAEILLQRTRADTVDRFLPVFWDRYPSWEDIAKSSEHELAEILRPIGLWKERSSVLFRLANEMVKRGGIFPRDRTELEALPGVGQYIANAIEMICFQTPRPLVDTNMARLLERHFAERDLADIRYDPYLQKLAFRLVDVPNYMEINWAVMDFAALVCVVRSPKCNVCPMVRHCNYARRFRVTRDHPIRKIER